MKLNAWKNPPYAEIAEAIHPKKPDIGNNDYYLVVYKGSGAMITIPKKVASEEAIRIMVAGVAEIIERSKETLMDRIRAVFR